MVSVISLIHVEKHVINITLMVCSSLEHGSFVKEIYDA